LKKYGKRLRLSPNEEQLIYNYRGGERKVINSPKILSLDIETSLMKFMGWGIYEQRIDYKNILQDWFVICWAGKWLFEDKIISDVITPKEVLMLKKNPLTIEDNGNDERIINSIWKVLDKADIVITHNGRNFDHRKLNARFIYYGLARPSHYLTIDTLKSSQKEFAFASHKQAFITKLLKLPEKEKTEIELWHDCRNGIPQRIKEMDRYCRGDVRGLEELYLTIRSWISNHPNLPLFTDYDGSRCPACESNKLTWKDFYYTPMGKYKTFRCECGAIGRSRKAEKRKVLTKVC